MTLKEAYNLVHKKTQDHRHNINMNSGFKRQLMDAEMDMHGQNTMNFFEGRRKYTGTYNVDDLSKKAFCM